MHVELLPCDKQGIIYENIQESIIQNPDKSLKELYFLVRINNVKCLSTRYKVTKYTKIWKNLLYFFFRKYFVNTNVLEKNNSHVQMLGVILIILKFLIKRLFHTQKLIRM